ncbi:hypothetical protein R1flu_023182 [Riccia fluitans]|uniref:LRAT domain-containing protein n=1 Tax=Riccia fluitans TaxID=41844 RepID=A0ABD1XRC5_9MARC
MDFLSKINHAAKESELKPGDHIYCYRSKSYSSYAHHGIYIGNGKVIHFLDNSESAAGDTEGPSTNFFGFSSSGGSSSSRCEECRTNKSGGVQLTCLKCFLKGDTLRLFCYGVSKAELALNVRGGCSGLKAEEAEKVLHRAQYLLQTDGFVWDERMRSGDQSRFEELVMSKQTRRSDMVTECAFTGTCPLFTR